MADPAGEEVRPSVLIVDRDVLWRHGVQPDGNPVIGLLYGLVFSSLIWAVIAAAMLLIIT